MSARPRATKMTTLAIGTSMALAIPQNNCGKCLAMGGCGFPKIQDCLDGCEFDFPASTVNSSCLY